MKITVFTLGSRGDIQPFIPLSLGLRDAGFEIRFASFGTYREMVSQYELEFFEISGDPQSTMNSQAGQAWLTSGRNIFTASTQMHRAIINEDLQNQFNDSLEACRGADAVVYSFMGASAYHAAEKLGLPSIFALLQPFTRSRKMPSMIFPALPLGGFYNRLTHWVSEQAVWQIVRGPIDRWRTESLGLPAFSWRGPFDRLYEKRMPYLYGFSPSVVPRPVDWPEWHHISGYWFLERDPNWSPPQELVRFIDSGEKPVSIGFGSMSGKHARKLLKIAIEAVQLAKRRAVLLGGWAQLSTETIPDTIFMIDSIPHDWLFPRMAAVVHHGGSGTTAAGLRAGVPAVIIPFFGDQPFWGQRIRALGVGPQPIQRKSLTASKLARAITCALNDQFMKDQASALGARIRAEDGVQSAVDFIRDYLC
jgi:sterol 3beta-glucosyltransferase